MRRQEHPLETLAWPEKEHARPSRRSSVLRTGVCTLLALGVSFAVLTRAAPAFADPTPAELAAARNLFLEVRKLEDQRQWAEARTRLETIAKVRMTPQVRFHIALCDEHLGRLVAALNGFQEARADALAARIDQVVTESEQHITAIRPRIPTLKIVLAEDSPATTVLVDGSPIAVALLTLPLPLDPGKHTVRAQAPGRDDFAQEATLAEGETQTLQIVLTEAAPSPTPVQPAAVSPAAPAPAPPPPPPLQPPPPPAAPAADRSTSSTTGWIVAGVGGATLVGAGIAALVRSSAISDIDQSCPGYSDCDPALKSTRDRAQTSGVLAGVLAGVGVATVATGGVLLYLSSDRSSEPTTAVVSPVVSPRGAGLTGALRW